MRLLTLLTAILLLTNCEQQRQANKGEQLRTLIKKLGVQELPYSYDLTTGQRNTTYTIDMNSTDTLFIRGTTVGGLLADTSNFYSILYYQAGDLIYPFISTFDKQGNLIDNENIGIGYCGGLTIDLDTCIDRVTINQNLEIESFYKAIGTGEDSTGQEFKICNSITGKGKINISGQIEIIKSELNDCL